MQPATTTIIAISAASESLLREIFMRVHRKSERDAEANIDAARQPEAIAQFIVDIATAIDRRQRKVESPHADVETEVPVAGDRPVAADAEAIVEALVFAVTTDDRSVRVEVERNAEVAVDVP